MKLYSWNVNGLRAVLRKDVLQPFLAAENPDILCLQETKAKQGQVEIDLPDYVETWDPLPAPAIPAPPPFRKPNLSQPAPPCPL